MASTILAAAIAFLLVSALFLVSIIQNSVDERRVVATPNIPIAAVTNFKDYDQWSTFFSRYKWSQVMADIVPIVGSAGTFKVLLQADFQMYTSLLLITCIASQLVRRQRLTFC